MNKTKYKKKSVFSAQIMSFITLLQNVSHSVCIGTNFRNTQHVVFERKNKGFPWN